MPVVVTLDTGDSYTLDRNLYTHQVAQAVNNKRGTGRLIEFQNNATPSRTIFIDPDHVVSIKDDGYAY